LNCVLIEKERRKKKKEEGKSFSYPFWNQNLNLFFVRSGWILFLSKEVSVVPSQKEKRETPKKVFFALSCDDLSIKVFPKKRILHFDFIFSASFPLPLLFFRSFSVNTQKIGKN